MPPTADLARGAGSLAPETQLLVACARPTASTVCRARLAALRSSDLDWDLLLDEAGRHHVIPLLHRHADTLQPPPLAAQRLERDFAAAARRSLALTAALVEALGALRASGIGVTPFKGPALAVAVYGSVILRQFDDVDVLVHQADLPRAERILTQRGYCPATGHGPARAWTRDDMTLRLHCGLASPWVGTGGIAGLWVRRRPLELGDTRVSAPCPEDHLLLLTLHAAQRMWGRLGWLIDVAVLLERYPALDHFAVRYEARRHGIERLVRLGLGLAQTLVDAPLPREVAAWVRRDRRLDHLVRDVCTRRLRPAAAPPGVLEAARFHLRSRERWSDRVRDAARGAGTVLASPARLAVRATTGLRRQAPIAVFHR